MVTAPVIVCLPIADRRTSFTFYRDGLGFDSIGEVADDGVPEPLQFVLNDGVRLVLIPTGGFGWIIGDRDVAGQGNSECVFNPPAENDSGVDEMVQRACDAGRRPSPRQDTNLGVTRALSPTPMVMSGW